MPKHAAAREEFESRRPAIRGLPAARGNPVAAGGRAVMGARRADAFADLDPHRPVRRRATLARERGVPAAGKR